MRTHQAFALAFLCSAGLGACEPHKGYSGTGGATAGGCASACPYDQVCEAGACLPIPAGAVGSNCGGDEACATGTCYQGKSFDHGYCSTSCGGQIDPNEEPCPPGSTCVQLGEASASCLDRCGADQGNCRAGYVCAVIEGEDVCAPGCGVAPDCPAGTGCDLSIRLCVEGYVAGKAGSACNGSGDCVAGGCLTAPETGGVFAGGSCAATCSAGALGTPCASPLGGIDGACAKIAILPDESAYHCMQTCSTGVDCRAGYICSTDTTLAESPGTALCVPSCKTYTCPSGTFCDTTGGLCVTGSPRSSGTPGPSAVDTVDLGSWTMGPKSSTFVTADLAVPDDALSVTIVANPQSGGSKVVLTKLDAPSGATIYDYSDPLSTEFVTITLNAGPFAALFPNSPRLGLSTGSWHFQLGAKPETTVGLKALVKRGSGLYQGGSLPLVLWFTQQGYMSASSAESDADMQLAIGRFQQIYQAIGISVGPVLYQDVPGDLATKLAVIQGDADLEALFAVANASSEPGLHFFFVDSFAADDSGYSTLGQSGGIPGPPAFPGLPRGGVAVALAFLSENPKRFASTMAHEAGHYLGLFHTTEQNGQSFDPLADTPECQSSALDGDNDGAVDDTECAGAGAANLMFWLAGPGHADLSADQKWVLLRNPSISLAGE